MLGCWRITYFHIHTYENEKLSTRHLQIILITHRHTNKSVRKITEKRDFTYDRKKKKRIPQAMYFCIKYASWYFLENKARVSVRISKNGKQCKIKKNKVHWPHFSRIQVRTATSYHLKNALNKSISR